MKARVVPFEIELRDSQNRKMGTGRGTHLPHLTEILNWEREKLEGAAWALRKQNAAGAGDAYMKMGFVWEIAVEDALKTYIRGQGERVRGQKEIEVDGILMTIDARITGEWRGIEEYKFTYRSEGPLLRSTLPLHEALEEHFEWYLKQVKGYCYGATIVFKKAFNKARLVVFFAMGDYTRGDRKTEHGFPHPHCYELKFSLEDLAENWIERLRNRDAMMRERRRDARKVTGTR